MTRRGGWWAVVLVGVVAAWNARVVGGRQAPPDSVAARSTNAWTGVPIDVNFHGADLRAVLRLLAETGGVNLVIDPSVPLAPVDLQLTRVPWDEVFDLVLETNQLEREIRGTVVRVISTAALQQEDAARAKQAAARADAEAAATLTTRTFRLNYAAGLQVVAILKAAVLSQHGDAQVDERTNRLVVKDVAANLEAVARLVADLDRPEPQVEIEAQIVETDHDSARALGVEWGVSGRAVPELGTTTPFVFPNTGTLSGRTGVQQGAAVGDGADPRAGAGEKTGTAVNLPATGATSAIGLTLGAVTGAFTLDLALSALQHQGKLHILSTPRVMTQNNHEAEVTTGFQVPFQTVSNSTVVIEFRDAALKLSVKPHITAADTVVMSIVLENDFPDFSRAVGGNPSINTQRALTQVQVEDGRTAVIGGIKQSTDSVKDDRTPGIARLPLLGWLFRRREAASSSQELLIFITPRIMRGTS